MKKLLMLVVLCAFSAGVMAVGPSDYAIKTGDDAVAINGKLAGLSGWFDGVSVASQSDFDALKVAVALLAPEAYGTGATQVQRDTAQKLVSDYAEWLGLSADAKPVVVKPAVVRALTDTEKVQLKSWRRNAPAKSDRVSIAKFEELKAIEAAAAKK